MFIDDLGNYLKLSLPDYAQSELTAEERPCAAIVCPYTLGQD